MLVFIMKEYRDHYFLKAKRENYPARSVYKLKELDANDIVVIAGKGHETYQEINGVRYDFDDRVMIAEALKLRQD